MQNHFFIILTSVIAIIVLFLSGCGQIKVSGKVTFADGTPLSTGKVIFENATDSYTAQIHEDGTFSLGTLTDGTGIPADKYNVAVFAAEKISQEVNSLSAKKPIAKPTKPLVRRTPKKPNIKFLVAEKYRSPKTSGIKYDIKKNIRDIVIVVEKP
jgi:hypothetical protein